MNKEGIQSRKRGGHVSLLCAAYVILTEERASGLLLCTYDGVGGAGVGCRVLFGLEFQC